MNPPTVSIQSQKGYSNSSAFYPLGYIGANHDLRADEYGAAQAVTVVTEIQRGVKFWQQWLSGLTWHIYDGNTDEVLVSSTDRRVNPGMGALWFNAMKRFPEDWKHDFFESIAFSDWVYAETYIAKLSNTVQVADYMWLNPLAVEPDIQRGKITGYRYSGDEGYYLLPPGQVAYRIAQRHPMDDWRGISPILTAIDKINVHENVYRSLNAFYRNNMQLGGIVSGKPNEGSFSIDGTTVEQVKTDMARNHKGVDNAFRWFFSNAPVDVNQFEQVDIEKNYNIIAPLRKEIAMALGVPPVLSGDPTEVNYDNADKVMKNWWSTDGIPYAKKVANFVNRQLLSDIEKGNDVYFGFDFTPFEVEPPEIISIDVQSGTVDLYESSKRRGYEPNEKLKGVRIINGVPMHDDLIAQKAREGLQDSKQESDTLATDSKVAVPTSEVFGYHIEAGIVDINEARAQIGLPPKQAKETNELQELQAKLSVMVTAYQAGIPTAISAQMVGLSIPTPPQASEPESVVTDVTDNEPIAPDTEKSITIDGHTLAIETWDYTPAKARKELITWQKHVKNDRTRAFIPEYTRGDIADSVIAGLQSDSEITSVFDAAFAMLPQGIDPLESAFKSVFEAILADDEPTFTKSLLSIDNEFTSRFEGVLSDIRSGNIDNRRRAGDIIRQMIRTFGYRAFVQGLEDGGVSDTPSEDDEIEIARLRSEQTSYVANLTRVLIREDGVTDAQAAGKPDMWFKKAIMPFYYAGYESAKANAMMEFAGDDGEESCSTCKRLKGQRHRLKDWKRKQLRPQVDTENFICGGWKCSHILIPTTGKAQGKW